MLYHSILLCFIAAIATAVPASQDKRATKLPKCYGDREFPNSSNFDLKDGKTLFATAPAVDVDGGLKFPNFRRFKATASQLKPKNGDNVAITNVVAPNGDNKAQIVAPDPSLQRFSLTRLSYGCASNFGITATECTITIKGKKADGSADTTRKLEFQPAKLTDGQLKSQLIEVDFTGDLFKDVVTVTFSVDGESQGKFIAIDDVGYTQCFK